MCAVSGCLSEVISGVKDTCGEVRGRLDKSASQPHTLTVSAYFHRTVSTGRQMLPALFHSLTQYSEYCGQLVPLLLNQGARVSFQLPTCDLAVSASLHPGRVCLLNY